MTAHKPGDPTTLNRLYGRSKGKPLRAGQPAFDVRPDGGGVDLLAGARGDDVGIGRRELSHERSVA